MVYILTTLNLVSLEGTLPTYTGKSTVTQRLCDAGSGLTHLVFTGLLVASLVPDSFPAVLHSDMAHRRVAQEW